MDNFQVFFLPAMSGKRFCTFHPAIGEARGAVLYLHPFAEEMNKSRRMAALQSRSFAAEGFAVLQMDLLGCGDSSGEFTDGRWEHWKEDAQLGVQWLRQYADERVHLWGLRLGALLAADVAAGKKTVISSLLLWQPVISGEQHLTQYLRLRVANEFLGAGVVMSGTQELRKELQSGTALEIGGYELAPELARSIDLLKLADFAVPGIPTTWFEIVPEMGRPVSPAARRTAEAWAHRGARVEIQCVPGRSFWNTLEIHECAALIGATTSALKGKPS